MLKHLNPSGKLCKRVVILGAGGFVGGGVFQKLIQKEVEVVGISRKEIDFLKEDAVSKLENLLRVDDSLVITVAKIPGENNAILLENIVMLERICQVLDKKKLEQVIYISSDAVYADLDEPITETSPTVPTHPYALYGAMHLAREFMLKSVLQDTPLCILRPSIIYGLKDPHNGYGINRFRRLVEEGKDIVLFGEGEERRDHVFIGDVAEIIYLCLFHRSEGVLNIATGEVVSFKEIAEYIIQWKGAHCKIKSQKRKGPMPYKGFRPFKIDACLRAFPEFRFHSFHEGLNKEL